MNITKEMVERGKRALHVVSTYRGYNEETLAREYLRMESIYEAHVTAVLTAALTNNTSEESATEIERLRRLIAWCRPRLSKEVYRTSLDDQLANPRKDDGSKMTQGGIDGD